MILGALASGVAAVPELGSAFRESAPGRTVRWVFFSNEKPPFFQRTGTGSYYTHQRGSQQATFRGSFLMCGRPVC